MRSKSSRNLSWHRMWPLKKGKDPELQLSPLKIC